jgi:2-methylcitrate dehydratase
LDAADIKHLLTRTKVVEHPDLTAKYPDGIPTRIIITTRDGRRIVRERDYALGHPLNPMNDRQVEAKFHQIAGDAISAAQADRLFQAVWQLDEVTDLTAFLGLAAL